MGTKSAAKCSLCNRDVHGEETTFCLDLGDELFIRHASAQGDWIRCFCDRIVCSACEQGGCCPTCYQRFLDTLKRSGLRPRLRGEG
jgi:hypothetical protein